MPRRRKSRRRNPQGSAVRGARRIGGGEIRGLDVYHTLLTLSWAGFFAWFALAFLAFNVAFGLLFLLQEGAVAQARAGSFADVFFFSVQTMATLGYGQLYPQTLYANLLATLEVLLGLGGLALATGLIFARFSRPTARVMFSRSAVIARHNGVPTLMFRAANQRRNLILEAQVSVSILRNETTREGVPMRRFHELALARSRSPAFSLTWTVMHPIDDTSPLHGLTPESLREARVEILVVLVGVDETFSQTVHARHSYGIDAIVWNHRFADILRWLDDGTQIVDYRRFHDLEKLADPAS
jgi:inward rectifier potassium channel